MMSGNEPVVGGVTGVGTTGAIGRGVAGAGAGVGAGTGGSGFSTPENISSAGFGAGAADVGTDAGSVGTGGSSCIGKLIGGCGSIDEETIKSDSQNVRSGRVQEDCTRF